MNKKNTVRKITASVLCIAFAASGAACGLITTNSEKDMAQVIGTVDLTGYDEFKNDGKYAAYTPVLKNMNTRILKRDLVAYFLNTGYTYVNSYGYTYEKTFNLLMDNLVSRKIVVQYAMAYYLDSDSAYTVAGCETYIADQKSAETDSTVKAMYEAHPEILTMKYFLTDGGADQTDYERAIYSLDSMINSTLDSAEDSYIDKKTDSSTTSDETRTTPTNVGTKEDDYYSKDYAIYTGWNALDSCGTYEAKEGSTQTTRRKAYNAFLTNLSANNLLVEGEDTSVFQKLDYYYVEMSAQMEQALITKYSDTLNDEADQELTQEYVEAKYDAILSNNRNSYDDDQSAFETAIGSVSDTSFVTYSPKEGFGFVYNILLPFSATQTQLLSTYTNDKGLTKSEFYAKRAALLNNVRGKDLRSPWFSADEDTNYSYEATGEYYKNTKTSLNEKNYLFFEDNLTKSEGENPEYKKLKQYAGKYAYNGTVTFDEDDDQYICIPNELSVDGFMTEFNAYLNYILGSNSASGSKLSTYKTDGYKVGADGKFDYSEFMYYEGAVALQNTDHKDYFKKDTDQYKAISAVNELMFAYSSDTGCLNKYMGYTVSPYKTSYVSEFEYAAQYAIMKGEGAYVVCPSDYGWHVIYVSFKYDQGEVYEGGFDWNEKDIEGTFSNIFYESLKSTSSGSSSYATMVQNRVLTKYNTDTCVTKYTERYKDLLSISA